MPRDDWRMSRIGALVAALVGGGCKVSKEAPGAPGTTADAGDQERLERAVCAPAELGALPEINEQPPMPIGQGVCLEVAAAALFDACFQANGDCNAWKTANGACAQCVFTPENSPVKGPFITRDNALPKANQRGCLDSLAAGCGATYEAVNACTHAACESNPACNRAKAEALAACHQAAMRDVCRPLMREYSAKCGAGGLTDKRQCFPPSGGEAALRKFFTTLALRACGAPGAH